MSGLRRYIAEVTRVARTWVDSNQNGKKDKGEVKTRAGKTAVSVHGSRTRALDFAHLRAGATAYAPPGKPVGRERRIENVYRGVVASRR